MAAVGRHTTNLTSAYDKLADAYHATVDPDGAGLDDPTFDRSQKILPAPPL